MRGADAGLNIVERMTRESAPRAGCHKEANAGPGVDRDCAVSQVGDEFLEPDPADLFDRLGVDDDIGAQGAK